MFIRKRVDGNYYVCRIPGGTSAHAGRRGNTIYRDWFLLKNGYGINLGSRLQVNDITFPKELIGKKIRLKVEVI